MEFLERLNKLKTAFLLALLLLGITAYSSAMYMLKERVLPANPTTKQVQLQHADPDLAAKIEPQNASKYWSFGPRNILQPPRANIKTTGHFTFSATSDSKIDLARVSGYYQCVPDGPVDRVEIQIPAGWVPQTTGMGDVYKTRVSGTKRELQIILKEIQKTEFKIVLNLSMPVKSQPQIDFPEIIFKDAEKETGYIGMMVTPTFDVKAGTVEKLELASDQAALPGAVQAYKYSSHPYKLSVALTRKQLVAGKPDKPVKPVDKPGNPVGKPTDKPADNPADAKFEVPFTFKGMVKRELDKPIVLLEDKQDKKLKRCSVGDTLNGLTITRIYPTSVIVKDDKGNEYELQDSLRQKYDYE